MTSGMGCVIGKMGFCFFVVTTIVVGMISLCLHIDGVCFGMLMSLIGGTKFSLILFGVFIAEVPFDFMLPPIEENRFLVCDQMLFVCRRSGCV